MITPNRPDRLSQTDQGCRALAIECRIHNRDATHTQFRSRDADALRRLSNQSQRRLKAGSRVSAQRHYCARLLTIGTYNRPAQPSHRESPIQLQRRFGQSVQQRSARENLRKGLKRRVPARQFRQAAHKLIEPLVGQRATGPTGNDEVLNAKMLREPGVLLRFRIFGRQPIANIVGVAENCSLHTPADQRYEQRGHDQNRRTTPLIKRSLSHAWLSVKRIGIERVN